MASQWEKDLGDTNRKLIALGPRAVVALGEALEGKKAWNDNEVLAARDILDRLGMGTDGQLKTKAYADS